MGTVDRSGRQHCKSDGTEIMITIERREISSFTRVALLSGESNLPIQPFDRSQRRSFKEDLIYSASAGGSKIIERGTRDHHGIP